MSKTAPNTAPSRKPKKTGKERTASVQSDSDIEFSIAVLERDDGDQYGCFSFTPSCLQFCRRQPAAFLVALFILMTANFYMHSVVPASAVQLTRRFGFSSYQLASIRASWDVGTLIMLFPVAYFGEYGVHRPQWMAVGGVIAGVGGLIMTMPHFLLAVDEIKPEHKVKFCDPTTDAPHLPQCFLASDILTAVFMLGEMLVGIGLAPCVIMGLTFLDENATHRQSNIYTAVLSTCQLIGPAAAFLITSLISRKMHGDSDKVGVVHWRAHQDDESWYGAWWLSMFVGVVLSWLGAALMFPFPKELSGTVVAHIRDTREALMIGQNTFRDHSTGKISFSKKFKELFSNGVFLGMLLEHCSRIFLINGMIVFLPIYIRMMYDFDVMQAVIYLAIFVALFALGGLIYATIVQYVLHFDVRENLRLTAVAAGLTVIVSFAFIMHGPPAKLAGISARFPNDTTFTDTSAIKGFKDMIRECNNKCKCGYGMELACYKPQKITYYSKCLAGCKKPGAEFKTVRRLTYCFDCTILTLLFVFLSLNCACTPHGNETLVDGLCENTTSKYQWAFLLALGWLAMSLYGRWNSVQQILLRAVPFQVRGVALGVVEVTARFIGSIPAPYTFGAIYYNACVLKMPVCEETSDTPEQRECAWYNRVRLAVSVTFYLITLSVLSLAGVVFALIMYECKRRRQGSVKPPSKSVQYIEINREKIFTMKKLNWQ